MGWRHGKPPLLAELSTPAERTPKVVRKMLRLGRSKSTLYGTTSIVNLDSVEGAYPCYFFRNSDFFRYKNVLDAAIVSTTKSHKLCLNPLSCRCESLKNTELCARFGTAVRDPINEETAAKAYIVDSQVDSKDEEVVLTYIRKKYGKPKLMNIDLGYVSATVAVAKERIS